MAMRVTGRNRNGGLFADRRSPQSHVLTKAPGETVHAEWGVRNSGTTTSPATMRIMDPASVILASIGPINVLAGSSITLSLNWTIPASAQVGAVLEQNLVMFSGEGAIAVHGFTVNVGGGGGGGGNLAVIGEPLIT